MDNGWYKGISGEGEATRKGDDFEMEVKKISNKKEDKRKYLRINIPITYSWAELR